MVPKFLFEPLTPKPGVVVVLEFESMDKARKCYESEAYQAAKSVRVKACDTDLILAEGA